MTACKKLLHEQIQLTLTTGKSCILTMLPALGVARDLVFLLPTFSFLTEDETWTNIQIQLNA